MRLIENSGTNRVIDVLREATRRGCTVDIATPVWSLFAYSTLRELLDCAATTRLITSDESICASALLGSVADRSSRNRLQTRSLARQCAEWLRTKVDVRSSPSPLPQAAYCV